MKGAARSSDDKASGAPRPVCTIIIEDPSGLIPWIVKFMPSSDVQQELQASGQIHTALQGQLHMLGSPAMVIAEEWK